MLIELPDTSSCDLFLLIEGALAPLTTFMTECEYNHILSHNGLLPCGKLMPIPICLGMSNTVKINDKIDLTSSPSCAVLIDCSITITDIFPIDWIGEAAYITKQEPLKTIDDIWTTPHPFCSQQLRDMWNRIGSSGVYVSGILTVKECSVRPPWDKYYKIPAEIRRVKGNQIAFQTRNPIHKAHLALIEAAISTVENPITILNPTIGPSQPGDVPLPHRMACYENTLKYFPQPSELRVVPIAMRMAGPMEALWHAIIRQNHGYTHFIVGRDHAGPSTKQVNGTTWYNPMDAINLLTLNQKKLDIKIIPGEDLKYDFASGLYKSSGSGIVSGTAFRLMVAKGENVPEWFTFHENIEILKQIYSQPPKHKRGFCVQITGLSGSGKSTLAISLKEYIHQIDPSRSVVILDGDVLRNYFKDLSFDRASRSMQTRRIGFIASMLVSSGAIALCANIAPYEEDRESNRKSLFAPDSYIEIYVSTSLEDCERRDTKGLYKKARAGEIPSFTGISDPYEIPKHPEITVYASTNVKKTDSLRTVVRWLVKHGYLLG